MRPYYAILKDSFREALANRSLWVLIAGLTIVLLGLAPFNLREELASVLTPRDVVDIDAFAARLKRQGQSDRPSPGRHVWGLLSDGLKLNLDRQSTAERPGGRQARRESFGLLSEINDLLSKPELYDEESWSRVDLGDEAKALLAEGVALLPENKLRRFNRLAIEAAFPADVLSSRESDLYVSYFWARLFGPIPQIIRREDLLTAIVTGLMNFLLGFIGVLIGIVFTAPIVPQTFEAGAIDLLLSKPVGRSLTFLTKFAGGCFYIFLAGAFFVGGLFLILGLQHGMWRPNLLWCIPIFVFLFGIYYAVSALAGVVWRNMIVSIIAVVIVWGACFGVNFTKTLVEQLAYSPTRIMKLIPVDDELMGVNEGNRVVRWDSPTQQWTDTFKARPSANPALPFEIPTPMIGPVYDSKEGRLMAVPAAGGQFGFLAGRPTLKLGVRDDDWQQTDGVEAPESTSELFLDPENRLVAVSNRGIFRLEGDPTRREERLSVFGFDLPIPGRASAFADVGPELRISGTISSDMDRSTGQIVVFDGVEVSVYSLGAERKYGLQAKAALEVEGPSAVALAKGTVVVADGKGSIRAFQADTLAEVARFQPYGENTVRSITASADGQWFAAVFHHGKLWVYDAQTRKEARVRVEGQGTISAALFLPSGELAVADHFTRITRYQPGTFSRAQQLEPAMSWGDRVYWYGIVPAYTVFPKPGELDGAIHYAITGQEAVTAFNPEAPRGRETTVKLNVWDPLWQNALFMAAVLAFGCLYVSRKDF
jgi:ABC-type transport system involved in multi-copper enzyme maturation permease subunit